MAEQITLQLERRNQQGSHIARRMRRQGRVPAVLYGHGAPEMVSVDEHDFITHVKPAQFGSQIVRLTLDDQDAGRALVKAVQLNTLKQRVLAVDFQRISMDDVVNVAVPVAVIGQNASARAGGVLEQMLHSVNLRCRAGDIPEQLEVDATRLHMGDATHAADLALPRGAELLDKPDEVIAVVLTPTIPMDEEVVEVEPVSGPELTGEREKESPYSAAA